jgi:hypothetical protein
MRVLLLVSIVLCSSIVCLAQNTKKVLGNDDFGEVVKPLVKMSGPTSIGDSFPKWELIGEIQERNNEKLELRKMVNTGGALIGIRLSSSGEHLWIADPKTLKQLDRLLNRIFTLRDLPGGKVTGLQNAKIEVKRADDDNYSINGTEQSQDNGKTSVTGVTLTLNQYNMATFCQLVAAALKE